MSWFANRLAEPSTRIGFGLFIAFLTQLMTRPPVTSADWLTIGAGMLGGVAGIVTKAPGSPDAPLPLGVIRTP